MKPDSMPVSTRKQNRLSKQNESKYVYGEQKKQRFSPFCLYVDDVFVLPVLKTDFPSFRQHLRVSSCSLQQLHCKTS